MSTLAIALSFCLFFAVARAQQAPAEPLPTLKQESHFAPSLARRSGYLVSLPAGYDAPENRHKRYPVLYLLHGLGASPADFTRYADIRPFLAPYELIVVMPEGHDSWYVNSRAVPGNRYEDYLVKDLPAHLAATYRVAPGPQAIAGISMGGFGAVHLALRHPDKYFFAASLSGPLGVPANYATLAQGNGPGFAGRLAQSLRAAFGGADTQALARQYDLAALARQAPSGSLPEFFLAVGEQDVLRQYITPSTRALAEALRAKGASVRLIEAPGGHDAWFWAAQLPGLLARVSRRAAA